MRRQRRLAWRFAVLSGIVAAAGAVGELQRGTDDAPLRGAPSKAPLGEPPEFLRLQMEAIPLLQAAVLVDGVLTPEERREAHEAYATCALEETGAGHDRGPPRLPRGERHRGRRRVPGIAGAGLRDGPVPVPGLPGNRSAGRDVTTPRTRRGRIRLVAAVVVVATGCAAVGTSTTTTTLPEAVERLFAEADGFLAEVIADGVVTPAEVERSVLAFRRCLQERGVVVEDFRFSLYGPDDGLDYQISGVTSEAVAGAEAIVASCDAEYLEPVSIGYWYLLPDSERARVAGMGEAYRSCLGRAGHDVEGDRLPAGVVARTRSGVDTSDLPVLVTVRLPQAGDLPRGHAPT